MFSLFICKHSSVHHFLHIFHFWSFIFEQNCHRITLIRMSIWCVCSFFHGGSSLEVALGVFSLFFLIHLDLFYSYIVCVWCVCAYVLCASEKTMVTSMGKMPRPFLWVCDLWWGRWRWWCVRIFCSVAGTLSFHTNAVHQVTVKVVRYTHTNTLKKRVKRTILKTSTEKSFFIMLLLLYFS